MSKLDDLIMELCPDGVEYLELERVLKIRNGSDYKGFNEGEIPVYGSGGIMTYVDRFSYNKPSVLIPRKGSIDKLYYVDTPFWNVDTVFYTEINETMIIPKYVYYCLAREHLEQYNSAGGVPSLTQKILNKVKIPVPPIEIQHEIVCVLDNYTELTAELTKELTAEFTTRKRQYEYYRNNLFNFGDNVEYKTLPEICVNCDRQRKPVTKNERESGSYPYYGASGIVDYVADYIFDGEYLLVSEDGANLLARVTPIAFSISGKNWVNNHAHVLQFKTYEMRKYVEFYLNSIDLSRFISGGAQPKLNQENMNKIPIPMPSLDVIRGIVDILYRFDIHSNDIISSISVEIATRKKQYEYYLDKLLTFKRLA